MTNNYHTPQDGAADWHIPLNENFEKLNVDVEVRDVADNRSNHTPHEDAKFLATDTYDVYLGDGSSWNLIGNVSGSGSSFSGSHNDLTDVASDDHHTKTTSSEITHNDTQGGTTSDAHHAKTTSQGELNDFSSDANNISVGSSAPSNPSTNDIWIDTS